MKIVSDVPAVWLNIVDAAGGTFKGAALLCGAFVASHVSLYRRTEGEQVLTKHYMVKADGVMPFKYDKDLDQLDHLLIWEYEPLAMGGRERRVARFREGVTLNDFERLKGPPRLAIEDGVEWARSFDSSNDLMRRMRESKAWQEPKRGNQVDIYAKDFLPELPGDTQLSPRHLDPAEIPPEKQTGIDKILQGGG